MDATRSALIDSHCHLHLLTAAPTRTQVAAAVAEAAADGVVHMLCVSVRLDQLTALAALVEGLPAVSISAGLHPNERVHAEPELDELVRCAARPDVVAVGETGLDYYRSEGDLTWQRQRFERHIEAARRVRKPLIVHTRAARADTLAILRAAGAAEVGGVMHCFTEDWDTARAALDLGFYISFSGIATFRNATEIQAVAARVPLDRLLIETDAPYLAPVPHRGQPNRPCYVRHVAECLAGLRRLSLENLAQATTENFWRCFPDARPAPH